MRDPAKPKESNIEAAAALPVALGDLVHTRALLRRGETTLAAIMARCLEIAGSPACEHTFLQLDAAGAMAQARAAARPERPLAGLPVSVKDLFDVQGQVSAAGSTILATQAPAQQDCPAVARLRAAGGTLLGRTNMVEFAFSGVGINPHHGTPRNAADAGVARIPGGSSSGAAVSVATGAAFVGLGSDTGGSIRIPAALNGIVGFKNTARLVPLDGAVPLSPSMDTACAMTRSVRDAIVAHEVLSSSTVTRSPAPLSAYRLAVAGTLMHDGLDPTVAAAYARTLATLRAHGARITELALPELAELPQINATGGLSPAESHAWHRHLLGQHGTDYDPRVAARILRGAAMSAADYLDLLQARRDWIRRMEHALQGVDAVLSPTVPIVAPPIAEVAPGTERDAAFFAVNGQLLRNTSAVNMLDGCALSLPCHEAGELPVGLMVWHAALRDDAVLNIGLQIERILARR